jgi:GGDEF domain-containing protein
MMETPGIDQEVLAARLKNNLEVRNGGTSRSYVISISVGMVSCGPESSVTLGDLMKRADLLMYSQKRNKSGT